MILKMFYLHSFILKQKCFVIVFNINWIIKFHWCEEIYVILHACCYMFNILLSTLNIGGTWNVNVCMYKWMNNQFEASSVMGSWNSLYFYFDGVCVKSVFWISELMIQNFKQTRTGHRSVRTSVGQVLKKKSEVQ